MRAIASCFLMLILFSGCMYRMPSDDDVDLKPTTNNPDVVNQRDPGWMPGYRY